MRKHAETIRATNQGLLLARLGAELERRFADLIIECDPSPIELAYEQLLHIAASHSLLALEPEALIEECLRGKYVVAYESHEKFFPGVGAPVRATLPALGHEVYNC